MIRVLPPQVAAQIAAGEVVERPASVVKELLENAIDAGARRIEIEIAGGGTELIRVSDDGCGIAAPEIDLAFARHATSKLENADDLSSLRSLGFRGEALPSIAAAADVTMTSRTADAEAGLYVRLEGGPISDRGLQGAPPGTTVTVSNLFGRQPARRKFLRSPGSEAGHVSSLVSAYALAYPEIAFTLKLNGRSVLQTSGSGRLEDAAAPVYGGEVAAALLLLSPAEGAIQVLGGVCAPHVSRAGRGYVNIFVNRRWVQSRRLSFAVEQAYEGLLMTGRYPMAIVDIRLPGEDVDVNVHPTKAEVRFRDESAVFGAVQRAVRAALLAQAPAPSLTGSSPQALHLDVQPSTNPLWQHAAHLSTRSPAPIPAATVPGQALPVLRVIGQFGSIYIIAEGPEGIYLIDQHAAHERVLYDELLARRASRKPNGQGVLAPLVVELSPAQDVAISCSLDSLAEHGFQLEAFGPRTYRLRAVPALLSGEDIGGSFLAFVDEMLEAEGYASDRVAMSLACHSAVRAGQTLTPQEMRELVQQLERTAVPNTCPHGRPTLIQLSAETLAREFGRR